MRNTDFVALFETNRFINSKTPVQNAFKTRVAMATVWSPSVTCREFLRMRDTDFAALLEMNGFINPKSPMQNALIRRFPMAKVLES